MHKQYEITAVISTYNRSEQLGDALNCMLQQTNRNVCYEVIVVDNNSTDHTRDVVEAHLARGHSNLRYILEPRQGVSYARNTGIAQARSPIVAFVDDDVLVASDWIATIKRAFDANPAIDCVGGKVLPNWKTAAPPWLTRDHWMPLGLQDYGDSPLLIGAVNPLCLVSANLACRRSIFDEIGPFSIHLQRIRDGIGSIEDAELLERCWRAGRLCLYVPDLIATTEVPGERLTRKYHRRWHTGHGRFMAIGRSEEMERSSARLFDVPAHLYKQALDDLIGWLKCSLTMRPEPAFTYESRIRFFMGFFRKRREDYLAGDHSGQLRELASLLRSRFKKNRDQISSELS